MPSACVDDEDVLRGMTRLWVRSGTGCEEAREGGEGGVGDVVFDAFGVGFGVFGGDADGAEQFDDDAVAGVDAGGQGLAFWGEEYASVGECGGEALALEASDCLHGGCVGDAHAAGDVDGSGLARGGEEVGDQFGVIFEERCGPGTARLAEAVCLGGFLRHWGRVWLGGAHGL